MPHRISVIYLLGRPFAVNVNLKVPTSHIIPASFTKDGLQITAGSSGKCLKYQIGLFVQSNYSMTRLLMHAISNLKFSHDFSLVCTLLIILLKRDTKLPSFCQRPGTVSHFCSLPCFPSFSCKFVTANKL